MSFLTRNPAADVSSDSTLAAQVAAAREGDRLALEAVVRAVSNDVYRLALRMTAGVADAEDATQEILIKIITRLSTFRGDASPRTWAYRIAVNHLLDRRKSRVESFELSWEMFAEDLLNGLADPEEAHDSALADEVKLGCTLAMLTCLDRTDRLAYILGEVFDFPGDTAAQLLEISHESYRQRLSRARRRVEGFTESYCGLVNAEALCHCSRRVTRAVELGRVARDNLALSKHPRETATRYVREMEQLHATAALMRSHPEYAAPERVIQAILNSTVAAAEPGGM
jgi:RNA polymerase sigma factor (sigma-70 family)